MTVNLKDVDTRVAVGLPPMVPVVASKVVPGMVVVIFGTIENTLLPYPPSAFTGANAVMGTNSMSVFGLVMVRLVVKVTASTSKVNVAVADWLALSFIVTV